MQDAVGHHISYLRLSVTDRCNERCRYCLPEENQDWFAREEVLSFEEMLRVVRVGASLGVKKLRVTGGEPLTRPGVVEFCAELAKVPGINDIGVSTNGTLLTRSHGVGTVAEGLRRAGVRTVNISLDSLDRSAYQRSTRRDLLPSVLDGIEAARTAGFESIKLNCVLMKGQTEAELTRLVRFAGERRLLLRFIELMPVSTRDVLSDDQFLAAGVARRLIEEETGPLMARPDFRTNGPSTYFEVPGTAGQLVGFIGAMTNLHFCESCNKLRLTCDGKLRPCLGSYLEFDLREVLRSGCDDDQLRDFFLGVVARKPKEHDFRDSYLPGRKMIAIGG